LTELLGFALEEAAVELAGLELTGVELVVGPTGVVVLVLVIVMHVVSPDSQVMVLVVTKQPWQTGGGVGWYGFSVTVIVLVTVATGQVGAGGGTTVVGGGMTAVG
jgi:hypothetical protein